MMIKFKVAPKGSLKMEGILTMSHKDAYRLKVISQLEKRSMTIEEASEIVHIQNNVQPEILIS